MIRNERWSNSKEIARSLSINEAGPVLAYENYNPMTYGGEGHAMILGVSGSGKSRRGTIPMVLSVLQNGESAVIVDPKGELYNNTLSMVPEDYEVHVIDFRDFFDINAEGWNPLMTPYVLYKSDDPRDRHIAEEMIENLAYSMYPKAPNTDPFWVDEARNVFLAAVYGLFEAGKVSEINLASVFHFISLGEERWGAEMFLKHFADIQGISENVKMQIKSYVTTANDTRGGIRSTFLNGLSAFSRNSAVRDFLARNDLNINNIRGDKKTVIYVIIPDETEIYDRLAGVLVTQLATHYIRIAQNDHAGRLPIRVNMILEELGNIGSSIPNLPHLMTAGRSRNIRLAFVLQSMSQLKDIYGESKSSTIIGNADVKMVFRVHNYETLNEFSKLCGERIVGYEGRPTVNAPLITPAQLSVMETGQALVFVSGLRLKYITWIPDFTYMFDISDVKREFRSFAGNTTFEKDIFDIREFVKEHSDDKPFHVLLAEKEASADKFTEKSENVTIKEDRSNYKEDKPDKRDKKHKEKNFLDMLISDDDDKDDIDEEDTDFDIDELVRRIDEKIAALEKEEKEEKEKKEKQAQFVRLLDEYSKKRKEEED